MKAPAFQFYPKDFLVDTMTLTAEQTGCYIRLLSVAWVGIPGCKQTQLPADPQQLAIIAGVTDERWKTISQPILACFQAARGRLIHKRLGKELARQQANRKKKQDAAKARWNRTSVDAPALQMQSRTDALQLQSSSASALPTATTAETTSPAPQAPFDARAALFSDGLRISKAMTGKPEGSCRSLLGKWLKTAHDDAGRLLVLLRQAQADRRADLVPWIEACLKMDDEEAAAYRGAI